jgi:hypothetical protein
MYGYNSPYWSEGRGYPAPFGVPHILYNTVPLGGYAELLPSGLTSLPWQSPGSTGG